MTNRLLKKTMIVTCLLLVAGKMVYNVHSLVYETQSATWERLFNLGVFFCIFYFGITAFKKKSYQES